MEKCKYCGKTTDITSEIDLGTSGKLLVFACGHSDIEETIASKQERVRQAEYEAERIAKAIANRNEADANRRQQEEYNANRIAWQRGSDNVIHQRKSAQIRNRLREIEERD